MLKSLLELIAMETNDPDGYRSAICKQLLEIVDTMPLAPMAAAREKKVRAFVKETVGDLLINQRTNRTGRILSIHLGISGQTIDRYSMFK
jgi:hypothetical protein